MTAKAEKRASSPRENITDEGVHLRLEPVIKPPLAELLLQQAIDTNAGMGLIDRLLEMTERTWASQARIKFLAAMAAFKKTAPASVEKHGYSPDGGYSHADLSDLTDLISPLAAEQGIIFDWDLDQTGGAVEVTCVVSHVGGHEKRVSLRVVPEISQYLNAAQSLASAVTYLKRYTLQAAFGISSKNSDDDGRLSGSQGLPARPQQPQTVAPVEPEAQKHPAEEAVTDVAAREVVDQPIGRQPKPSKLPAVPQSMLDRNIDSYTQMIQSGKKTPDQIIDKLETMYFVNQDVINLIQDLANAEPIKEAA